MIQKYCKDTIVLTADVPYEDRAIYDYKWYLNNIYISNLYSCKYYLGKTGIFTIKLIISDKESGLQSTVLEKVSVIVPTRRALS